jgi:hypothetical protein
VIIGGLFKRRWTTFAAIVLVAGLSAGTASASVGYIVTVDTSSVAGSTGFLDFQFNPGNATTQAATAQIINFDPGSGVLLGVPEVTGNVAGTLPGTTTFVNSTALNEYFQQFKFGTRFSFILLLSGPAIDSPNGTSTAGSTFGVGLYDSTQTPILTNQGAVTGFAGQVDIDLNGKTIATAFPTASNGPSVVTFSPFAPDFYQARYTANLPAGDSFVDITNAGTSTEGNLCANIYTFDPSEELISCCSCSVTPNGLQSLSVRNSLINKPLTPAIPTAVVVKVVASTGTATCNAATVTAASLRPGLRAWGTTLHALPTTPTTYGTTEAPFSFGDLSSTELAHVTQVCAFIQADGSGFGICKGCAAGGLGAGSSTQ